MNEITSRAHGRVNLIGEHTDYNGGWVLPTTIPQYTEITLKKNNDKKVVLISTRSDQKQSKREYNYELGQEKKNGDWMDYLQGATSLLGTSKLSGFEARITSTIPEGSGLSSSAALEMSFLKGLNQLFELGLTEVELALLGQRIENEFVGARVGIMDQMATSLAEKGEVLYLDTLKLTYERIPLPMDNMDIMVINSGVSHKLAATDGGYNQRRAQCEEACERLGIKLLREIDLKDLETKDLPEILMKRARHVVSENERVHEAVKAIKNEDPLRLGELFIASHRSMRDDFEVSIPEIDLLVDLCLLDDNVFGARLTGGGFGGSIVAVAKKGHKTEIAQKVIKEYNLKTGEKATLLA